MEIRERLSSSLCLFEQGVPAKGTISEARGDVPAILKNGKQWAKEKDTESVQRERDPSCLSCHCK